MTRLGLVFLICGIFYFSVNAQSFKVSDIPAALLGNVNAVVRLDEKLIKIEGRRSLTCRETRITTLLNKKGMNVVGAVLPYNPSIRIKHLEASILDANGKEIKKFKEKDFIDHLLYDGLSLHIDARIKFLNFDPSYFPVTIRFEAEYSTSNTAFLPDWIPQSYSGVSVEKSVYDIQSLPELGLKWKKKNLSVSDLTEEETLNGIRFTCHNLAPIKFESQSPPAQAIVPRVMFSLSLFHIEGVDGTATDWGSFGKWMYEDLLTETFDLPVTTQRKMQSLVADKSSTYEKAKTIYEYVQQNTRYISIQAGIGGWKPMKASEVDRLGYGDCKALSNYTRCLLDAVGIPSDYTLVYADTEDRINLESDFSSIQGNHIILRIAAEGHHYWVDCTNQELPFGFLGDFTDDRNVLIVNANGGEITRTPAYINEDNRQITRADCTLDESGNLEATVKIVSTGNQYDSKYHLKKQDYESQVSHYRNYWRNINHLSIDSLHFINLKDSIQFIENLSIHAEKNVIFSGSSGLLIPNLFNNMVGIPEKYRNRTQELAIDRGFQDLDYFEYIIPDAFVIESIPDPVSLENEFGKYTMEVRVEDQVIRYKREFMLLEGIYPKEKYEAYRQFIRQVSKNDSIKIVINKRP